MSDKLAFLSNVGLQQVQIMLQKMPDHDRRIMRLCAGKATVVVHYAVNYAKGGQKDRDHVLIRSYNDLSEEPFEERELKRAKELTATEFDHQIEEVAMAMQAKADATIEPAPAESKAAETLMAKVRQIALIDYA